MKPVAYMGSASVLSWLIAALVVDERTGRGLGNERRRVGRRGDVHLVGADEHEELGDEIKGE